MVRLMLTFLLTLLGLSAGSGYHCPVRREIAPCTCRLQEPKLTTIVVSCEEMPSFARIVEILHNRFPPEQDISLKVSHSKLPDLQEQKFQQLGMNISSLNLNFDELSYLDEASFDGLEGVKYLSLADTILQEMPYKVLRKMPQLKTLDLGRTQIEAVRDEDFLGLDTLKHLVLPNNLVASIDKYSLPRTIERIHLGRNNLRDLNSSLRALTDLQWIFINGNFLTNLEDQLPPVAPNLILIYAANNQIRRLPQELRNYPLMDSLFFQNNDLESLDGLLKHSRRLKRLHMNHNKIHTLAEDEFSECELIDIELGHNNLHSLNGAFRPLKKLRTLNLTHNHLKEFSIGEIHGLRSLKVVDLSHNHIHRLHGHMGNRVDMGSKVDEIRLEFNELTALNGALSSIHGIQRLYLHNNKIASISADDLIGFDRLQILDISYNHIQSLEETSKTVLPRLNELIANHNYLTSVKEDLHGMPNLCRANLSSNRIRKVDEDFGTRSSCMGTGMLNVVLHDNPIICHNDYSRIVEYLQKNATILQADLSDCPPLTTTTTTTTTTTEAPLPSLLLHPPLIVTLIRSQPSQHMVPIKYNTPKEQLENSVLIPEHAQVTPSVTQEVVAPPVIESTTEPMEEKKEERKLTNPILLLKDEGRNITLVIPMENGVIKKDHGVDHYTKEDDRGILGQKLPSTITNIEIVDIKPLPKPLQLSSLASDHQENDSLVKPIPLSAPAVLLEPKPYANPLSLPINVETSNQPMAEMKPKPLPLSVGLSSKLEQSENESLTKDSVTNVEKTSGDIISIPKPLSLSLEPSHAPDEGHTEVPPQINPTHQVNETNSEVTSPNRAPEQHAEEVIEPGEEKSSTND